MGKYDNLLTKREIEILLLIAEGLKNHEIAERLFISPRTADTHKKNICRKLNLNCTVELACYAAANKDELKEVYHKKYKKLVYENTDFPYLLS
jgi:DNA-binding NarL/FixJ family response regulator